MMERPKPPAEPAKAHPTTPERETIPFDAYALAVTALKAPHGYAESNGYVARRADKDLAELSLPIPGGGHRKMVFKFPETIEVELLHFTETNQQ